MAPYKIFHVHYSYTNKMWMPEDLTSVDDDVENVKKYVEALNDEYYHNILKEYEEYGSKISTKLQNDRFALTLGGDPIITTWADYEPILFDALSISGNKIRILGK